MSLALLTRPQAALAGASATGPVFDAPLFITDALISSRGSNIFEGNWENTNYSTNNGAAVYVATANPVVIRNSVIRGQCYAISGLVASCQIEVRNCLLLTKNTTSAGSSGSRCVNIEKPKSLIVENNTLIGGGIYVGIVPPAGSTDLLRIRYNKSLNVFGLISDGAGGFIYERANVTGVYFHARQFLQLNVGVFEDADISWNHIEQTPLVGRVEDAFNLTSCVGRTGARMKFHDNFIFGGGPTTPYTASHSGCGFVTEGTAQYIDIEDNQIVNHCNVGIGIAEGSDIAVRRNRLVSCGRVLGRAMFQPNRAGYVNAGMTNIELTDNGWSWVGAGGAQLGWYRPSPGPGNTFTGDYSLGATTTEATEATDLAYWRSKSAGRQIGSTLAPW